MQRTGQNLFNSDGDRGGFLGPGRGLAGHDKDQERIRALEVGGGPLYDSREPLKTACGCALSLMARWR